MMGSTSSVARTVVCLVAVLLAACSSSAQDPYGMQFFNLGCVGLAGYPGKQETDSRWLGTHFTVTVQDSTLPCSAKIVDPGYRLSGDELVLTYTADSSKELAMCNCDFAWIVSFKNLPPGRHYDVKLKAKKIYPRL